VRYKKSDGITFFRKWAACINCPAALARGEKDSKQLALAKKMAVSFMWLKPIYKMLLPLC
jgi:hypothetical protein